MVDVREPSGALCGISESPGTPCFADRVRPVELADLAWVHRLFLKRYPTNYDWHTTDVWFRHTVLNNPLSIFAARTDDAFVLANTTVMPWLPGKYECNIVTICSDSDVDPTWQVVQLLRASIDWARKRKCYIWKISSDLETDITPLAMRVGAHQVHTRFALGLE